LKSFQPDASAKDTLKNNVPKTGQLKNKTTPYPLSLRPTYLLHITGKQSESKQ